MHRTLNVKFVLAILLGIAVLGGAGYFFHNWQLGHNAHRLLEMADQAVAEKDDAKAEALYAQYLKFVPNDIPAVKKYAQVLDRRAVLAQRPDVVEALEKVLQARPDEHDLRMRLVHNLVLVNRYDDAIAQLKKLLPKREDKSEIWHMLGWCQESQRDYKSAVASFREAIKLDSKQFKSYALLTQVLQDELKKPDDAVEAMDEMVKANAESWQAYLLRSRFHRRRGEEKLATRDLQEALRLAPGEMEVAFESAGASIARAETMAAQKDYKGAKTELEATRKEFPAQIIVWCALADLAIALKQWKEADAVLEQAAAQKGFADRVELLLAKSRLWVRRGSPADLASLTKMSDDAPKAEAIGDRIRLCRELGDTWYRLGDWGRAERLWNAVALDLPRDATVRLYLFELALQKNQLDMARRWHEELRRIDGEQGAVTRFCSAALLVKDARGDRKKLDAARKVLHDLRLEADLPRLALLSATIFEMDGQYQNAIGEYSKALKLGDRQVRTMARLLQILIDRREFGRAEQEFGLYEDMLPRTRELARLSAEVAAGTGTANYASVAVARAGQAVTLPSRDYRDYLWLARIHQAIGEPAQAETLLRDGIKLEGRNPEPWIALMAHLGGTNQREQGLKELERLKKELPKDRQPLAIARAYDVLHLPVEAAKAYQAAQRAQPDDAAIVGHAADFHRRAGDTEAARKLYETLLGPNMSPAGELAVKARRQLAVLLAESGDANARAKALALIDENASSRGETVADERVRLFVRGQAESERKACMQKLQASFERQTPSADERVLLGVLLQAAGQLPQARMQLAQAVEQHPMAPEYLARYARLLIQTEDLSEARLMVSRLEALEPDSGRVRELKAALAAK